MEHMVSSRVLRSSILALIFGYFITTYFPYKLQDDNDSGFSRALEFLPIEGAFGPESLTFDPAGDGPYAGVSDGRIVKWVPHQRRWVDFAFTSPNREACEKQDKHKHEDIEDKCGRPLGLRFNEKTWELYIADAYMGLLVVGPNGGSASRVVNEVDGIPVGFTNGLDIDQQTGLVYFTTSSSQYPRRNYMSVLLSQENTGRLYQYDPKTKQVTKLLDNLKFPNGVSLSKNNDYLLVAETTSCKILRYWLENTTKAGTSEVFTEVLGFPDNIKRNSKGEFWVGVYSKRGKVLKWLFSFPSLGRTIVNLPYSAVKLTSILGKLRATGLAVKLDENGEVVQVLEDTSGKLKFVSEVCEKDGDLWFGSVILPFAGLYKDYKSQN